MHRFLLLLVAVALWGVTTLSRADDKDEPKKKAPPGLAQFLKGTPADFIKQFDKDKDGTLSKEEMPPWLADRFGDLDRNGDGKLGPREVETLLQALRKQFGQPEKPPAGRPEVERRVNELLERMDTNKDGKLSKDETRGPLAEGFARFDANKDGYLDKTELRQALDRLMAMQKGPPGKGDARPPQPGRGRPDFDALDKDADGRLTREELKGTAFADLFESIDANKDGKLDRKEFEAHLKKQEEKKEK